MLDMTPGGGRTRFAGGFRHRGSSTFPARSNIAESSGWRNTGGDTSLMLGTPRPPFQRNCQLLRLLPGEVPARFLEHLGTPSTSFRRRIRRQERSLKARIDPTLSCRAGYLDAPTYAWYPESTLDSAKE